MRCYICDFELVIPSGLEAIVACPNCKRNILLDGISSEEIERLQGQILALTLVNKSQDETINMWKKECENSKIITVRLNERINELIESNNRLRDARGYAGAESVDELEKIIDDLLEENRKLQDENITLQEELKNSWDRHI